MKAHQHFCFGFVRLELLLALALVLLLFQLFPSLWTGTLWALDVRNWPRTVWFAMNWIVLLTLAAIRFGPDLYNEWQERQKRRATERAMERKQQELKEQREMLERLKRGRERRIY